MSKTRTTAPSKPSGANTPDSPQTQQSTTFPHPELHRETFCPELYTPDTPLAIIQFFEQELGLNGLVAISPAFKQRYRIHYGNRLTGRAWGDHDEGYIALSNDPIPVPIVRFKRTTKRGQVILMQNIIKIELTATSQPVYRHPLFHTHAEEAPVIEDERLTDNRAPRRISTARNDQARET